MKNLKIYLSIMLVIVMSAVCIVPIYAQTYVPPENAESKMSEDLLEILSAAEDDELIPVWIWFKEIDENELKRRVEERSGYTSEEIDNLTSSIYDRELSDVFDSFLSDRNSNYEELNDKIKEYLDNSKEQRQEQTKIREEYFSVRTQVLSEMYSANNNGILKMLDINTESVEFCSTLSASAIVKLSKSRIVEVAESDKISGLSYYENTISVEPSYERQMKSMHVDDLVGLGELSGNGINVLMIDTNYIRPDLDYYNNLANPENVYNIINGTVYPASYTTVSTDTTLINPNVSINSTHANLCASVLQMYAPDVNIYCVYGGAYSDMEYAFTNSSLNINLVNGSVNYGCNSTYDGTTNWFDNIIYNNNMPMIASAGNSSDWYSDGWSDLITPAKGYNCIAVGSYYTPINSGQNDIQNDIMYNYRYGPVDSTVIPNYKPDVIMASYDTSRAAPALTGMLACALEAVPGLKKKPEIIKAIAMASCHRKVLPYSTEEVQETMAAGLTQKQGAGAVDAYRLLKIAITGTYGEYTLTTECMTKEQELRLPNDSSTLNYNNDGLNVSVSWLEKINSYYSHYNRDLNLKLYQSNNLIAVSSVNNSGKQMVYLPNGNNNLIYRMEVENVTANTSDTRDVKFGYAWCEKSYCTLSDYGMQGYQAVGHSVHINTAIDNSSIPSYSDDLLYTWQSSSDGNVWTDCSETGSSYNLTANDYLKYIKCVVSFTNNSLILPVSVSMQTSTKVFRFGDVTLDGYVNSDDVMLLNRYCVYLDTLNNEQMKAADVNVDGIVDMIDVTLLQRYVEHEITALPVV